MPRKLYAIKHKVEHLHDDKHHYIRIGSATEGRDGIILCTIEAIPINWDGTFAMYPTNTEDKREEDS